MAVDAGQEVGFDIADEEEAGGVLVFDSDKPFPLGCLGYSHPVMI